MSPWSHTDLISFFSFFRKTLLYLFPKIYLWIKWKNKKTLSIPHMGQSQSQPGHQQGSQIQFQRLSGNQNHLLGWVLFTFTEKKESTQSSFKAFEIMFSVSLVRWGVLFCLRRGPLIENEILNAERWRCNKSHHVCDGMRSYKND